MNRQNGLLAVCVALFALAVALLVYSGSLSGPYLFDDLPAFNGNLDQVPFPPWMNWLHPETRPLLQVWFTIIRRVSESPVAVYRVAGVFLHVANCLLLLILVKSVGTQVLLAHSGSPLPTSNPTYIAWSVPLIWLVHPLCVQAVCSIVQQAELLMSTFFISYLIVIARNAKKSNWCSAMALYFCLLAGIYAKVVMVAAIPAGILLNALLSEKSIVAVTRSHWRFHLAPLLGGTVVALTMLPLLLRAEAGIGFGGDSPPTYVYFLSSLRSFLGYLGLAAWPAKLSIDRGAHFVTTLGDAMPYVMVTAAYLVFACLAWNNRWPGIPLGRLLGCLMLMPILILAPTSSFIPTADVFFEHRFYLPLAFVIWSVVLLVWYFFTTREIAKSNAYLVPIAMLGLMVVSFATRTYMRAFDYSSAERVWRAALLVDPDNTRAAQNYVASLQRANRDDDIEGELIELMMAADRRGKKVEVLAHQLAKDYMRRGNAEKAFPILNEVTARSPQIQDLLTDWQRRDIGERWFDLAVACALLNRPAEGIKAISQTLRVSSKDPSAHALAADLYELVDDQALASQHRRASEVLSRQTLDLAKPPVDAEIAK